MVSRELLEQAHRWTLYLMAVVMVFAASGAVMAQVQDVPTGQYRLVYFQYLCTQNTTSSVSMPQGGRGSGGQMRTESSTKVWILSEVVRVAEDGSGETEQKLANYRMYTTLGGTKLTVTATERGITTTLDGRIVANEAAGVGETMQVMTEDVHRQLFVEGVRILISPTGEQHVLSPAKSGTAIAAIDMLSTMGGDIGLIFPEKLVVVGDSWTTERSVKVPPAGELKMEVSNTLKSVESIDGTRYARVDQKLEMSGDAESKSEMGEVSVEGTIEYLFAVDKGYIQQVEFDLVQQIAPPGKGGGSVRSKVRGRIEKRTL